MNADHPAAGGAGPGHTTRGNAEHAHVAALAKRKSIEIWPRTKPASARRTASPANGQGADRGRRRTDQRYDSAYRFGAICAARGTGAALAMPYADMQAMQLHLDEISRAVARGAHAVLLLDRAGWHTTGRVALPQNITIIFLPSRAPELARPCAQGPARGTKAGTPYTVSRSRTTPHPRPLCLLTGQRVCEVRVQRA